MSRERNKIYGCAPRNWDACDLVRKTTTIRQRAIVGRAKPGRPTPRDLSSNWCGSRETQCPRGVGLRHPLDVGSGDPFFP
jgi:hypothetical protein